MKTSKVGIVAVTVALACMFVLSNFVLLRTSTAGDFILGDFKGTYVSGLSGSAQNTGTFHGYLYLVADGEGHVTGSWNISDDDTHVATGWQFDESYVVTPEGEVAFSTTTGSIITQLNVFLANNNKEILGTFSLVSPIFGLATVHGVQQ